MASRGLNLDINSKTERLSSAVAEWLLDNVDSLRQLKLIWFRHIYVTFDVDQNTGEIDRRWVGVIGSFPSKSARQKVMEWARQGIRVPELNRAAS